MCKLFKCASEYVCKHVYAPECLNVNVCVFAISAASASCFSSCVGRKISATLHALWQNAPPKRLYYLSSSGDYKALQINAEQRNWQQTHYCSTAGDKALCAPQGSLCGLSAAIWKWNTHREMRVLLENLCCMKSLWSDYYRSSQNKLTESFFARISLDVNRFLRQLLLSSHNTIHSRLSLLISLPRQPHYFLPKHRSPPRLPHCPGNNSASSQGDGGCPY